jgi:predicted  nucleic acid-binding Zn-ribbon protein
MTDIPIVLTIGLGVVMCLVALFGLRSSQKNQVASILISTGIFGTFLGIAIALYGFDPRAVEDSVPELIGGMRMAFVSSVIGVFLALILRGISLGTADSTESEGKSADDIYGVLNRQTELMETVAEKTTKQLNGVERALVGDGDSTLISQLKLMRSESRDGITEMKQELRDFSQTLAENNSKALFEALEGAVRDFNEKISEQFGENFKQLNSAVGQLLEWQNQYRGQLTKAIQVFEEISDSLHEADSAINSVATNSESLREVSERQSQWLSAQIQSQEELTQRLEAFSSLANEAKSAFPIIQQNLEEITQGVKRTVRDSIAAIEGAVEGLEDGAEAVKEATSGISASVEKAAEDLGSRLVELSQESQERMTHLSTQLSETLDRNYSAFQENLLEATDRNQARLEESVQELDQMLGEELTKSLQSLGNHLATLSNRFVEDYTPLTNQLRRVVEMSRRIES